MGCGGSKKEVEAEVETPHTAEELVEAESEDVKISFNIAESDAANEALRLERQAHAATNARACSISQQLGALKERHEGFCANTSGSARSPRRGQSA